MYLWQIRHIPNPRRNFVSLTPFILMTVVTVVAASLAVSSTLIGQTDSKGPREGAAAAERQADISSAGEKSASAFMDQVRQSLNRHSSIQAEIEQTVSIGTQRFTASGRYVSRGSKLRLEYTIKPDQEISGSLLEVCDGKELWSLMKTPDTKRVTHRDVQQIRAAVAVGRIVPDAVLTAELGLGGLTALLASLERTMIFNAMKHETAENRSRIIVQGKWKPEIRNRWPRGTDDSLPVYIPDMVRVSVDSATMFPERIDYIKRQVEKDKKVYRAMVSLQFRNVTFDAPIDDQEFTFVTPEDVVPEDITRQFLDRLKKTPDPSGGEAGSAEK